MSSTALQLTLSSPTRLTRFVWRKLPCCPQGTVGFVKFDIKDMNSTACVDPEKRIREVAQVAMMGFREVLIAGGYVNKVKHDTWCMHISIEVYLQVNRRA